MGLGNFFLPRNAPPRSATPKMGGTTRGRHADGPGLGRCKYCSNDGKFETRNAKGAKIRVCESCKKMLA